MSNDVLNSLFLNGVTKEEVIKEVKNLKSKQSCGFDGINMYTVKMVIDEIALPITHICNKSFEHGVFPSKLKICKIIPIYKNGDKQLFTNYRPVSLLPQFSKIVEKLFNKRLMDFVDKNELLYNGQYGFRHNMSTSLALLQLTEDITTQMDEANYTIGIFIDLKKAFDTIDHEILIKTLEYYGIRGIASKWLKSYLADRSQVVSINNEVSDSIKLRCGVPQGFILGPSLFLLYINDIYKVSNLMNFILFAVDTNLFCSGRNLQSLCEIVSKELNKLHVWFQVNKLSLNISKTNYMLFSNKMIESVPKISINNEDIEHVYSSKFLGVQVDCKFSWKCHVQYIRSKLAKNAGVLRKLKYLLDKEVLFTVQFVNITLLELLL